MTPKHKLFLVISTTLGVFVFCNYVYAATYGSGTFGNAKYSSDEESVVNSTDCTKDKPNGKVNITSISQGINNLTVNFKGGLEPFNKYEIKWGYSKDLSENYLGDKSFGNEKSKKFELTNLKPDTNYFVKVRAINYCNGGKWSDTVLAKTLVESNQLVVMPSLIEYESTEKNTEAVKAESNNSRLSSLILNVVDSKNQALVNVPIILKELSKSQNSNEKGEVSFVDIPYGTYTVQIDYKDVQTIQTIFLNDYTVKEVRLTIQIPEKNAVVASNNTKKGLVIGTGVLFGSAALILIRKKVLKN